MEMTPVAFAECLLVHAAAASRFVPPLPRSCHGDALATRSGRSGPGRTRPRAPQRRARIQEYRVTTSEAVRISGFVPGIDRAWFARACRLIPRRGERVAVVDLARAMENIALERDDVSWGPNNTFRFPKRGGTGAIWRSLAARIGSDRFQLNRRIVETADKPADASRVVEDTIQGMVNTRLIRSPHDVVSRWHYPAAYGYPTPSLRRNELLAAIHAGLKVTGISSRGRFGAWKYEVSNQDHSFMQGVEWVNWALREVPETTVRFAETANAMWGRIS